MFHPLKPAELLYYAECEGYLRTRRERILAAIEKTKITYPNGCGTSEFSRILQGNGVSFYSLTQDEQNLILELLNE